MLSVTCAVAWHVAGLQRLETRWPRVGAAADRPAAGQDNVHDLMDGDSLSCPAYFGRRYIVFDCSYH